MIREIKDLEIINSFLKNFNVTIENIGIYSHYNVYELNEKIVGIIAYDLIYDRIEIEYIYVEKDYRNRGYASDLMENLVEIGFDNNCTNISLEVRESNNTAISFYKKHDFIEVAKREKYYKNEDGILMVRELV